MERSCILLNVHRLFDPEGLPVARALGATGDEWTAADYRRKLANVAACLRAACDDEPPAVLALLEVESVRILSDLRDALGWHDLAIVDELAPDPSLEGLDVTLMLDRTLFEVPSLEARSIALDNGFATRDLLSVRVELAGSRQPVALMVTHWPSRLVGEGESLRFAYSTYLFRMLVSFLKFSKAEIIRSDGSIAMPAGPQLLARWNTPCIVMGDYNDEPFDPSVREALRSTRFRDRVLRRGKLTGKSLVEVDNYLDKKLSLYNPCWALRFTDNREVGGTYYRSEWRSYDQVLLTHGAILDDAPLRFVEDSAEVVRVPGIPAAGEDAVVMANPNGSPRKFDRSHPEGVSDHFPLRFKLFFEG